MGDNLLKQKKLDLRYLRMARIWAENSYCKRRQVGALVVKDKMIISDGYNGTPSGFENVCEEDGVTKPYVLHAEANAISKIARSHNSSDGATLYDGVFGTNRERPIWSINVLQARPPKLCSYSLYADAKAFSRLRQR